jgi:hypothetical protein
VDTTTRSLRFGYLAGIGFGFALLWALACAVLTAGNAHAQDGSSEQDGVLGGLVSTVESVGDKVVEPVAEKVVAPVVKPVADKVVEPVAENVVSPVVDKAVTPITEPVVEDVVKPVTEPVVEDVVKPVTDAVVTPVVDEVVTPVTESVLEPVTEAVSPVVEPVVEAVTPVVEPVVDVVVPVIETVIPGAPSTGVEVPGLETPGIPSTPLIPEEAAGIPAPAPSLPAVEIAIGAPTPGAATATRLQLTSGVAEAFRATTEPGRAAGDITGSAEPAEPIDAPPLSAAPIGSATATSAPSGGSAGVFAVLPLGFLAAHRAWVRRGAPGDEYGLPAPFFDTDASPD